MIVALVTEIITKPASLSGQVIRTSRRTLSSETVVLSAVSLVIWREYVGKKLKKQKHNCKVSTIIEQTIGLLGNYSIVRLKQVICRGKNIFNWIILSRSTWTVQHDWLKLPITKTVHFFPMNCFVGLVKLKYLYF